MSISVKGLVAIVALIALACFASSVLKVYLGLLFICLLVSFSVVGFVAWLFERLSARRVRTSDGPLVHHLSRRSRAEDSRRRSISVDEHADPPPAAGHTETETGARSEFGVNGLIL